MRWGVVRDGRRIEVNVRQVGESFEVELDGSKRVVELVPVGGGLAALLCPDGRGYALVGTRLDRSRWRISFGEMDFEVDLRDPLERELQGRAAAVRSQQEVRAPIPGKVVNAVVVAGDEVKAGQTLLVLEAMKMENQIVAESDGRIASVLVEPGATVEGGQVLMVID